MPANTDEIRPGWRITLTQQIPLLQGCWSTAVTGTVLAIEQQKTGSWFAHSSGGKLWLDRLVLQTDDGETVVCILDQYSHIEVDQQAKQAS